MRIKILLAGLLLIVSTTSALAAGPYIGAAGGISITHDGDTTVTGVGTVDTEYDTGFGFNLSAGYSFDPVRLEFEFGYKNADMDKISGPGGSIPVPDTEITVMSYMVNALYDFKTGSQFTPYIGAGLGLMNGELKSEGEKEDDTVFGYQVILGAAYNVNQNLAFDLSYRLQSAPSDFENSGVSIEYTSSNIMAGLRYNF
ncbi:MAG: outer membrane protein [Desulfuromonadaceae bacterium]